MALQLRELAGNLSTVALLKGQLAVAQQLLEMVLGKQPAGSLAPPISEQQEHLGRQLLVASQLRSPWPTPVQAVHTISVQGECPFLSSCKVSWLSKLDNRQPPLTPSAGLPCSARAL